METPERYERLPVARIREPSHQLRASIDPEALGELADSMASEGLHQPIGARGPLADGDYEVVWGHRRFLAARLLGWDTIAARVFGPAFDPLLAAVSENLQRTDLNPLEQAAAIQRFLDRGEPVAGIARLFRRSQAWVRERLALRDLPADLQAVVTASSLPLAVVRSLADIDHADYRAELIREAIRTGASATTADVWRAHYLSDRERILSNHLVVDQIVSERATFVITYPCDWCSALAAYETTTGFRFCARCTGELAQARSGATEKTG